MKPIPIDSADLVADHPCGTYIFELKAGRSAKLASTQAQRKRYAAPYAAAGKLVDAIPAFAVGSFDGWYEQDEEPCGSVTMTLAANGKLSGKVLTPVDGKGKSYSFAATSLKGVLKGEDGTVTNVSVAATLTGEKKVAVPLELAFSMDSIGIGSVDGGFSSPWSGALWMSQNGWKRAGYIFPYFKKDIATTLDNGLSLTFKKGGGGQGRGQDRRRRRRDAR